MTNSSSPTEAENTIADAALAIPVWDLPVRLFHWLLVPLIAFSWWSGEEELVGWHFRSGYAILFLVLFRLFWGFLGSSTARFASFVRGPAAVWRYLRRPGEWRGIGHTPLGALSVVTLLLLIAAQVSLGLLLSDEDGLYSAPLNHLVSFDMAEVAHELHEGLFNVLLAFIVLHVLAIIVYRFRGKKLLGAMISGRSTAYAAGAAPMVMAGAGRLLLCLGLAGALTAWIIAGAPPL